MTFNRCQSWIPFVVSVALACGEVRPPPRYEVVELSGTPYERGLQHGRRFRGKIRSLYSRLLTSSLIPMLNRDRTEISDFLLTYQDEQYDRGRFARRVLLESAEGIAASIPEPYLDEMHGIAEGAELPFEEILILNTFFDTMLGIRTVQTYLRQVHAPRLLSVEIGLAKDEVDNDCDGEIDEPDEGRIDPYEPSAHALLVEIPTDASLKLVLEDSDGVDPSSVRVMLGGRQYVASDPEIQTRTIGDEGQQLEVLFKPESLPPATPLTISVQATDLARVAEPPPVHANVMRAKWLSLSTVGLGKARHQIDTFATSDEKLVAPSIGFALRDGATADGSVIVAHHFALLDAGVVHEHAAAFVHRPADGLPFVMLGWTGLVWGMSGMNAAGLVWLANVSDTLDNPLVRELKRLLIAARLVSSGIPVGIQGREILSRTEDVATAVERLDGPTTVGWNHLIVDQRGAMAVVETDANILDDDDRGRHVYDSTEVDQWGRRLASVTDDDLRVASHYQRNTEDIDVRVLGFDVKPQRYWSNLWHRSLRAFHVLGERIAEGRGRIDVPEVIEILRTPALVDRRESMNAVIYEPESLRLRFAMGTEPATDGEFDVLELEAK